MAVLESRNEPIEKSHWYDFETGDPKHEVPYAGKRGEAGETRPTTLRDARKLRLVRSTTNFLSQVRKPQLEKWIVGQTIKATEANPRNPNEDDRAYHARVIEASREIVENASAYGTHVHNLIADVLESGSYNQKPFLDKYDSMVHASAEPILKWLKKSGIRIQRVEQNYINREHGYGGTTDLLFDTDEIRGIFDFKSRRTIPDKPVTPRDGQVMQLASYASCYYWGNRLPANMDQVKMLASGRWAVWGANLYFSTTELGRFDVIWYPPALMAAEAKSFLHLLEMVKYKDKWDPCDPERYNFVSKPKVANIISINGEVTDLAKTLAIKTEEAEKRRPVKKAAKKKAAKKKAPAKKRVVKKAAKKKITKRK